MNLFGLFKKSDVVADTFADTYEHPAPVARFVGPYAATFSGKPCSSCGASRTYGASCEYCQTIYPPDPTVLKKDELRTLLSEFFDKRDRSEYRDYPRPHRNLMASAYCVDLNLSARRYY